MQTSVWAFAHPFSSVNFFFFFLLQSTFAFSHLVYVLLSALSCTWESTIWSGWDFFRSGLALTLYYLLLELGSLGYESKVAFPVKVANLAKDDAFKGIAKAISTRLSTLYGRQDSAADETARAFLQRASRGETPWSISPESGCNKCDSSI